MIYFISKYAQSNIYYKILMFEILAERLFYKKFIIDNRKKNRRICEKDITIKLLLIVVHNKISMKNRTRKTLIL